MGNSTVGITREKLPILLNLHGLYEFDVTSIASNTPRDHPGQGCAKGEVN
jgi:hypothetical protein